MARERDDRRDLPPAHDLGLRAGRAAEIRTKLVDGRYLRLSAGRRRDRDHEGLLTRAWRSAADEPPRVAQAPVHGGVRRSVNLADLRFHRREPQPEAAEDHAIPCGPAAGLERDPLLDIGPLLQSVTQMEGKFADLAGDGAARVTDRPGDAVAARADKPPGPAAGWLAFLLHDLVEEQ